MVFKYLAVAAAVGSAVAQRPENTTICDYYTTALLMNNTAVNQKTLLTLVVNTAVIGNYTEPNVGIAVPGILAEGEVNGEKVNLLPYFSGGLASTNAGGMAGRAVNFLDDGGAAPLMENKPANGTDSAQYRLLTHLYEYFGALLGCSMMGNDDYPAYAGEASMYEVHKFMALSNAETQYFIGQVAMSAASFGVADSDLAIVGKALNDTFAFKCAPEAAVIPAQGAQLQSICIADDCPTAPNSTCDAYEAVVEPAVANGTSTDNSTATPTGTSGSGTPSSSGTDAPSASGTGPVESDNSAAAVGISFAAVAGALAAMFL